MIAAELRGGNKPGLNEALGWIGSRVDDIYGANVGRLDDVWIDPGTGMPRWLLVKEGRFGGRTTLIPFEDATAGAGHVWIPYEREVVRKAPEVQPGAPLTASVESALREHYRNAGGSHHAPAVPQPHPQSRPAYRQAPPTPARVQHAPAQHAPAPPGPPAYAAPPTQIRQPAPLAGPVEAGSPSALGMNAPARQPHDDGDGTVFGQARMHDGTHGHEYPGAGAPAPQAPGPPRYAPQPPPAPYAPPPHAPYFAPAGRSSYPPPAQPPAPQAQPRRPAAPYPAPAAAQSPEPRPLAPPLADGETPVAIPVIHGLDQPQRIEIELSGDLRISGELKGFSLKPMDPPPSGSDQA